MPLGLIGSEARKLKQRAAQQKQAVSQAQVAAPVAPVIPMADEPRGVLAPRPFRAMGGMSAENSPGQTIIDRARNRGQSEVPTVAKEASKLGAFMRGPSALPAPVAGPVDDGGIFRFFGYKPDETGQELGEWLISGRETIENAKAGQLARQEADAAERRKVQQEAQIQTWINSDDPRDRMRLAAALNAEKLGENLGSGFGSQIVAKGQIRDYGLGAQDSNIFNPDTGVSDGQAWQTNMDGTTTWGERQAETPAQKLAREKALQPTIENTGQAIVSVSPDGSNTKVLYQDPATPKSDGITPYQGLQTQLKLNEIDREIETGAQRNRSSLTTLDNSIALLDKFMGDTEKFNAVYGNMMNPTGKKDDLFNWSIGMDDNRKDGMAMLNQLGGQAFIDSIRDMKSAGGAGSVSDIEGAKLSTAATRLMEVNQTDVAAREAADEFKLRLSTFRNALAQDMAKKETAEKLRRQQVEEMMGGNPGSPVQSSQPTEDDDTFIDKLFGGIGNLFSGGGAQQPPIDLSRLTPQQLEQLEQQLSQGGGR
jgi:hypothetical protein